MSWAYRQSTGELIAPSGEVVGTGYSGHGAGVNNPADQAIPDVGPLPQGRWTLGPLQPTHPGLGPDVLPLYGQPGTNTFGRVGFYIHGDNAAMDHTGSEGCLVLVHPLRLMLAASTDRTLVVMA